MHYWIDINKTFFNHYIPQTFSQIDFWEFRLSPASSAEAYTPEIPQTDLSVGVLADLLEDRWSQVTSAAPGLALKT